MAFVIVVRICQYWMHLYRARDGSSVGFPPCTFRCWATFANDCIKKLRKSCSVDQHMNRGMRSRNEAAFLEFSKLLNPACSEYSAEHVQMKVWRHRNHPFYPWLLEHAYRPMMKAYMTDDEGDMADDLRRRSTRWPYSNRNT